MQSTTRWFLNEGSIRSWRPTEKYLGGEPDIVNAVNDRIFARVKKSQSYLSPHGRPATQVATLALSQRQIILKITDYILSPCSFGLMFLINSVIGQQKLVSRKYRVTVRGPPPVKHSIQRYSNERLSSLGKLFHLTFRKVERTFCRTLSLGINCP